MYRVLKFFVCNIFILGIKSQTVTAPCKTHDEACLTRVSRVIYDLAVLGNPELDIESSDPLLRDEIIGNLGVVNYKLFNSTVIGYRNCTVESSKYNLKESHVEFEMVCPELYMDGAYEIEGSLLGLPIRGKGPYWIRCQDYLINIVAQTERVIGNNKKLHLAFKNLKVNGDLRKNMDLQLDNLFDGNKELADPVHKLIKLNWKAVATLLQVPVVNSNFKAIFKNFNKYLKFCTP